jgi:argininosuccinate lyase
MPIEGKKTARKNSRGSVGIRKGRFATAMDSHFSAFNSSILFDKRLFPEDIAGSVAHVKMLVQQEIITVEDSREILKGLGEILVAMEKGQFKFREDLEDVHINIEEALRERIGDVAGKMHTARSRNDQVALDLRLFVRQKSPVIRTRLIHLMRMLTDKAEAAKQLILPGYTHLQRAQPIRLAHHLMAYFQMFQRDWQRFRDAEKRSDQMPLGAAALAGTTFPIKRETVASLLGFSRVSENSMDAVSDRDFGVEFIFNASMVMMHLSRLSEELILWSSVEFGFCTLPDEFCSGSSIMPQKKNPDACELIRGKTGRVYGDLLALLTTLKGLPLAYNKDLQEDKEPLFDAVDTVHGCLRIMSGMLPGIEFHSARMLEAASDPTMAATDVADQLVREGIPFREAHGRVGAMMRSKVVGGETFEEGHSLPTPEQMVEARKHTGGTSLSSVMHQITLARSFLRRNGEPGDPRVEKKRRKKQT